MASYSVFIKPSAVKELEDVPLRERRRLALGIEQLANNPRPRGVQKLAGTERYRLRQGDYRIVYAVDDLKSKVLVVKVGHRRDIYR